MHRGNNIHCVFIRLHQSRFTVSSLNISDNLMGMHFKFFKTIFIISELEVFLIRYYLIVLILIDLLLSLTGNCINDFSNSHEFYAKRLSFPILNIKIHIWTFKAIQRTQQIFHLKLFDIIIFKIYGDMNVMQLKISDNI